MVGLGGIASVYIIFRGLSASLLLKLNAVVYWVRIPSFVVFETVVFSHMLLAETPEAGVSSVATVSGGGVSLPPSCRSETGETPGSNIAVCR